MTLLRCLKSFIPDLERPCASCGYSLEKGVRIVAVVDVFSGIACIALWSVLLSYVVNNPPKPSEVTNVSNRERNDDDMESTQNLIVALLIFLIIFSVIQSLSGWALYYAQKKRNISHLYAWLVVSGFSIPANGLLIKIYEMIVVFAYTDELNCEAQSKAMETFQQNPYWCTVKTQLYPTAAKSGIKKFTMDTPVPDLSYQKYSSAFYQKKTFLVNHSIESIFSTVIHENQIQSSSHVNTTST